MTKAVAAPTAKRLESLDFIRGCALFGILLMNIVGMGLGPAYDNPTIAGGDTGINLWTWLVVNVGFEGTQRALFSILFGAGVILLSSRLEAIGRPDSADIFFRRNLWLIGFGLFNAWILLWVGDILYFYGITALFLFAFRNLSGREAARRSVSAHSCSARRGARRNLQRAAACTRGRGGRAVARRQRSDEQKKAIEDWQEESAAGPPPAANVPALARQITPSYWSALTARAPRIMRTANPGGLYRFFFDIFGMMMIGMALFKLGVLTLETKTRTYLAMMAGGYADRAHRQHLRGQWIMDHGFTALAYAPGEYQLRLQPAGDDHRPSRRCWGCS